MRLHLNLQHDRDRVPMSFVILDSAATVLTS